MTGCAEEQADFQKTLEAAEQGHAEAQFNLGLMYYNGQGVPQEYKAAVQWFRKAAEQGDAEAQFNMGSMYYNGESVPQDYSEAYAWCNIAAVQGHENAAENRGIVAEKLSPSALSEARSLSNKYYEKYVVPFE
jgi:TPR repeat protein